MYPVSARRTGLLLVAALVALLLAGVAMYSLASSTAGASVNSAGVASFVGTDATSAGIITWTNDGHGQLIGSMQDFNANPGYVQGLATQPLKPGDLSFTGTLINGSVGPTRPIRPDADRHP